MALEGQPAGTPYTFPPLPRELSLQFGNLINIPPHPLGTSLHLRHYFPHGYIQANSVDTELDDGTLRV